MTKIVVNRCHGGFGLSKQAARALGINIGDNVSIPNQHWIGNNDLGIDSENEYAYRADPRLVAVVEKLGGVKASGALAELEVIEIPDDVSWEIEDYDGSEWVSEQHRRW